MNITLGGGECEGWTQSDDHRWRFLLPSMAKALEMTLVDPLSDIRIS